MATRAVRASHGLIAEADGLVSTARRELPLSFTQERAVVELAGLRLLAPLAGESRARGSEIGSVNTAHMANIHSPGTSRPAASDAFVFFGATGDLAFKQIFPALAGLIRDSNWTLPIIGLARHGDLAALRERASQSLAAHGLTDPAVLQRLHRQLRFVRGSVDDMDTFRRLRAELGTARHPLHYLAIPPAAFGTLNPTKIVPWRVSVP